MMIRPDVAARLQSLTVMAIVTPEIMTLISYFLLKIKALSRLNYTYIPNTGEKALYVTQLWISLTSWKLGTLGPQRAYWPQLFVWCENTQQFPVRSRSEVSDQKYSILSIQQFEKLHFVTEIWITMRHLRSIPRHMFLNSFHHIWWRFEYVFV